MVLLARSTALEVFGVLGLLIAVMAFAVIIFDLGQSSLLVRSSAQRAVESARVAWSWCRRGTFLLFGLCAFTGGVVAAADPRFLWLPLVAASLALEKTVEAESGILVAFEQAWTPAMLVLLRRAGVLVATGCAFALLPDATMPTYAISSLLLVSASLIMSGKLASRLLGAPSRSTGGLRGAFEGLHFLVANLTGMVRMLDVVFVSSFASLKAAGLYSAGTKLAMPLFLVPQTLASLFLPRAARLSAARLKRDAIMITAAAGVFSLLALVTAPFDAYIISIVYGERFVDAGPILAVTLIGFPWVALSSTLGSILQGRGHERYVSFNGMLFAFLTIVTMLLGLWQGGVVGLAVGLVVSYTAKYAALLFQVLRLRDNEDYA